MDCTVWPADSAYLAEGLRVMGDILSMASDNMGFVQYPVLTTQTSTAALIKHRHILDNSMMKHNLTVHHHVQILYSKPNSTANDTRALSQPGVAVFHANFDESSFHQSTAVKHGKVGPCELLRIADFVGFDDAKRPGASARVEQRLALQRGNNDLSVMSHQFELTQKHRPSWETHL